MEPSRQWQLAHDAAAMYEHVVVPTILGPFARILVDWSQLQPGEVLRDVGCGTGAVSRYAAPVLGPTGRVIATDINAGMLAVAQALPPVPGAPITWQQQNASDLPSDGIPVDVVICAQVVQFFPAKSQAFATLRSVLKPGGRLTLSVWCGPSENPYFQAQVAAVTRHLGNDSAASLLAGFGLADPAELRSLFVGAGFSSPHIEVAQRELTLPPLADFVPRHLLATPLAAAFAAAPPQAQQALVADICGYLADYLQPDGTVIVPFRTYLARGIA